MSTELYSLLNDEVVARNWDADKNDIEEMVNLYEGEIPDRFRRFFPKANPEHLVQVIPLAWDDLATSAGRLPDLRGEPRNQTATEEKAAGKLERICFYVLRKAKPTGKIFMRVLAWWLQVGRAVALVTPDFEHKCPRFEIRDPRTCYPGIKESAGNTIVELTDLTFKYEMKIDEARERGLAKPEEPGRYGRDGGAKTKINIIEYIDDKQWILVSEDGSSQVAQHNLGMVPGWVFQSFTPNKSAGRNRFKDQLALAVAISRLISAKMAFADKLTSSTIWARNYEGIVEMGGDTVIRLGPQGDIGQISPSQTLQVDQDIQMLNQFSRILNRNPEVRQGEITAKGSYTSAKTLEQLDAAIDTVVGADWDIIGPGLEYMFRVALAMYMTLWPNEEYTVSGDLKGERFLDTFTPAKDIGDRRNIRVDYGFGVGGYQGFLMHLQAGDAGYMSKRRVMESMPGISDVAAEMNMIDIEDMDEAGKALFQQQAATGQMDVVLWAELREDMAKKGTTLHEAILKYRERLAQQAVEAAGTDQAALTTPTPEAPVEQPLPGLPPEVLAGV